MNVRTSQASTATLTTVTTLMMGALALGMGTAPARACDPEGKRLSTYEQAVSSMATASPVHLRSLRAEPVVFAGGKEPGAVRLFVAGDDTTAHGSFEGHTLEVRIDDGAVSVTLDGERVPADRIRREGGRIVILDKDGREMRDLWIGTTDAPFAPRFEGLEGWKHTFQGAPGAAEEPKVMIGVVLDEAGPALAHHLGFEPGSATMIARVYEGLAADRAGLEQYDVITAVDGKSPADPAAVRAALAGRAPGDVVRLKAISRGRERTIDVQLEAFDRQRLADAGGAGGMEIATFDWAGVPHLDAEKLGDILIAPDESIFELSPRMRLRQHQPADEGDADADARLDRLDERLADLERMIDELIERVKRGG
jgi:hypothetical protein